MEFSDSERFAMDYQDDGKKKDFVLNCEFVKKKSNIVIAGLVLRISIAAIN